MSKIVNISICNRGVNCCSKYFDHGLFQVLVTQKDGQVNQVSVILSKQIYCQSLLIKLFFQLSLKTSVFSLHGILRMKAIWIEKFNIQTVERFRSLALRETVQMWSFLFWSVLFRVWSEQEIDRVSLHIQSKYGENGTEKGPFLVAFRAVFSTFIVNFEKVFTYSDIVFLYKKISQIFRDGKLLLEKVF